jgi:hypothetical protein
VLTGERRVLDGRSTNSTIQSGPRFCVVSVGGGGLLYCVNFRVHLFDPPGVWAPHRCLQPQPRGARDKLTSPWVPVSPTLSRVVVSR